MSLNDCVKETIMETYRDPLYKANVEDCLYYGYGAPVISIPEKKPIFNFLIDVDIVQNYVVAHGGQHLRVVTELNKISEIKREKNPDKIYLAVVAIRTSERMDGSYIDYDEYFFVDKKVMEELKRESEKESRDFSYIEFNMNYNIDNKNFITIWHSKGKNPEYFIIDSNRKIFRKYSYNKKIQLVNMLNYFIKYYKKIKQEDESTKIYERGLSTHKGYGKVDNSLPQERKYFLVKNNIAEEVPYEKIRTL